MGHALRYYPLGLILYTIFVCGVAAGRGDLLRQVLEIPLKRSARKEPLAYPRPFLLLVRARKALFNDAFTQTWCEPIAQRIRQVINDRIGEMMAEFSEPEFFFRGEFVLALTPIDLSTTNGLAVADRAPLPGLYLYMQEAYDVIEGLLLEHPDWLDKFYKNPSERNPRHFRPERIQGDCPQLHCNWPSRT